MMAPTPDLLIVTVPEVVGLASLSGVVVVGSFAFVYKALQDAKEEREQHREERREERRVRELEAEGKAASIKALHEAMSALRER